MKALIWLLRVIVFIVLFGLAVKNSGLVDLRFFFAQQWQVPLSLVILLAFVAGVGVGLSAMLASHVMQRRELNKLRRLRDAEQA